MSKLTQILLLSLLIASTLIAGAASAQSATPAPVLAMLVNSGINRTPLAATGYGAEKPLAPNIDETGRAKNRRVELVKTGQI